MVPIITALLLLPPPITVTPSLTSILGPDELVVTYEVASAAQIEVVESAAWRVVQQSRSMSMLTTNGVQTSLNSVRLSLRARRSGRVRLPEATAVVDGRRVHSPDVFIEVRGAVPDDSARDLARGNAFLEWEIPATAVVGQGMSVRLVLWLRRGLALEQWALRPVGVPSGITRTLDHDDVFGIASDRTVGDDTYVRVVVFQERWRVDRVGKLTIPVVRATIRLGGGTDPAKEALLAPSRAIEIGAQPGVQ